MTIKFQNTALEWEDLIVEKTIWMTHLRAAQTSGGVKLLSGLWAHGAHTAHRITPSGKSESHFQPCLISTDS